MKRGWWLSLLLLPISVFAAGDPNAACSNKIAQIENQGVHRGAFLQALKNIDTRTDKSPRYIFMSKLGRTRGPGELLVVDTHTGHVTPIPMTHGVPENAPDVLNHRRAFVMYFGGAQVKFDEDQYMKTGEISTVPVSASLRNKLAPGSDGEPQLIQGISRCERFGRKKQALQMHLVNNYCFEKENFDKIRKLIEDDAKAGSAPPLMFTYPTRNLDNYLNQVKLANDAPNACKILERMPNPSVSAPMVDSGSSPDTVQ
ncbi:MAG: hypothetical protein KF767_01565 [Bdellovibrionaceae bacterium]|nr:hypothetical protein [Pseudobdellovibrionaceae bacterium]